MPLTPEPTPPALGAAPPYSSAQLGSVNTQTPIQSLLPNATYFNATNSYFAAAGGGGGGAVTSVSAGAGMTVTPTTGAVVVSLPNVGVAATTNNVANITTDAQGRISATTSYGYVPVAPAALTAYAPLAGAAFTGAVSGIAPTVNANFATKQYVDEQIVIGGGVQSVSAADASITVAGTAANPTLAVATQAGVVPGAYTSANVTVDSKGIITAVANGTAPATLAAGTNIALDTTTTPGTTIIRQDITTFIDMGTNEINNCGNISAPVGAQIDLKGGEVNLVQSASALESPPPINFPFPSVMNLSAVGGIGITAGGGVGIAAGGAVAVTSGALLSLTSGGSVSIGSANILGATTEVEHVAFKDNEISCGTAGEKLIITEVDTINTVTFGAAGSISAPGAVNGTSLTATSGSVEALTGNVLALGAAPGQGMVEAQQKLVAPFGDIDTVFTGLVQLGNNAGVNELTFVSNEPGTHIITAIEEGAAAGQVPGGVVDTRLNPATLSYDDATKEVVISAKNGAGVVTEMSRASISPALAAYVPLAGTLAGAPVTGTIEVEPTTGSIESKNITTALLSAIPDIGFISALAPFQVEGGNLGVFNPAGSEIGLAASASPPVGEVATITYKYSVDDLIHLNKVLEGPGAVLDGNDVVPLLTFKDAQTFHVSKSGSDSNNGAANAPFLTVQAAVNAALATNSEAVVSIGPGVFEENITIASLAGILLSGCSQSDRLIEGTTLKGVISIQCNLQDNLQNNQVMISGCTVLGHIHDTSTKQHTLIVDGCRIEGDNSNGGKAIEVQVTATDARTFVSNCVITQEAGTTGTNPLISCNVGFLEMSQVQATVRAEGCAVTVSGSALITRMANCALASSSASANPNALLFLNSTTAAPHAIALTSFLYNVATSKTTPAILATRPSPGAITATVANCLFGIAGTLASDNVIQYGAGTALVLLVASNRSLNSAAAAYASQIQSGATVLPLSRVGESAVNTVNGLSGALTVAAGSGLSLSTVGNTLTLSNTRAGTVTSVGAGTGISVDNTTNPAVPVVTNTGVTRLVAGTNISLSAETGEITISASGGGGGPGGVDSVSGGTGITVDNTDPQNVIVNNAGVLSLTAQGGITNVGTASAPIIQLSGTGTVTFQDVNATTVDTTDMTSVNFPTVPGSALPTDARQLVVKAYVDNVNTGVLSVTAGDASINIGGTPSAPTVAVAASGVSGGTYTNATVTVGADGRLTAASSGTAPVTSVSAVLGETTSTGGTTPAIGLANAGTAGVYAYPSSVTTDNHGRVTAVTPGTQPITAINAGTGISVSGAAGSATISNSGVLSVSAADSSVTVAGTSSAPTVALPNQTLTPGAYQWPAVTVDQKGVITAVAENTVPFTSISAGTGISVSGSAGSATISNDGVTALNSKGGSVSLLGAGSVTIDNSVAGTITITGTDTTGVTSVSGTAGEIGVANGTTTAVVSLVNAGTAGTYAFPSSVQTDAKGRVIAVTAGTNPSGTFLPLAGGTMSGPINMGAQAITNAGTVTSTGVIAGALSLPNAGAGSGTAGITALQTDTNAAPTNNLFISQVSGALTLFKPLANPVILYTAGVSTNLYTYLVSQFYGERHVFTGSAVSPVLNYNTNSTYTVGGNSISLNPFYVELTNGSSSALTVKVRYPNGGIPPAAYPPASTAPTTVAPAGTWADQSIVIVGGTTSTTPTLASGATKRLFFNGTSWYLI